MQPVKSRGGQPRSEGGDIGRPAPHDGDNGLGRSQRSEASIAMLIQSSGPLAFGATKVLISARPCYAVPLRWRWEVACWLLVPPVGHSLHHACLVIAGGTGASGPNAQMPRSPLIPSPYWGQAQAMEDWGDQRQHAQCSTTQIALGSTRHSLPVRALSSCCRCWCSFADGASLVPSALSALPLIKTVVNRTWLVI